MQGRVNLIAMVRLPQCRSVLLYLPLSFDSVVLSCNVPSLFQKLEMHIFRLKGFTKFS